jgi:hypothetical protein
MNGSNAAMMPDLLHGGIPLILFFKFIDPDAGKAPIDGLEVLHLDGGALPLLLLQLLVKLVG